MIHLLDITVAKGGPDTIYLHVNLSTRCLEEANQKSNTDSKISLFVVERRKMMINAVIAITNIQWNDAVRLLKI